jgi:hypothetical protein
LAGILLSIGTTISQKIQFSGGPVVTYVNLTWNDPAMMYLNQLRAVKCFLEKISMMDNVIGVQQNMEYAFRVPSAMKIWKPLL